MTHHTDIDEPTNDMFEEVLATAAEPLPLSGGPLVGSLVLTAGYIEAANKFTFNSNNKPVLTLNFGSDPPTIWIDPDLAWDSAAKHFWNAVYRMVGKMAPFSGID
jgi:hypothetical protein